MSKLPVRNPDKLPVIEISKLKPLQGDLKELTEKNYAKLKASLEKYGFFVPVFTWNGYLLDGHGRQRVMTREGWGDTKVPYVNIEAKTEEEAKEKLLHITSQYQTITVEGLDSFMPSWHGLDLQFDNVRFEMPTLPPEGFVNHFDRAEDGDTLNPVDEYNQSTTNTLIMIFDNDEYKFAIETLRELIDAGRGLTPSQVMLSLLKEYKENADS
jgi:hypothetical protein